MEEPENPSSHVRPVNQGSRVRYPSTLWIDEIVFNPEVSGKVTRTSYDLELDEYDLRKLYEGIKKILDEQYVKATRIRFTGRQDFQ